MNKYDFMALPNFACSYCGIHDFHCVVQCSSPVCNRWFCNTKYPESKKSHIMNHMYKSRHNTIRDFDGQDFQCEICGEKNIYLLKINLKRGNISCNSCIKKKKLSINHQKWHPLIMEHRLPYGWTPKPFKENFKKMIILKPEQIDFLENSWKNGLFGRYEILNPFDVSQSPYSFVHKAKNIYENQYDYIKTMRSLLDVHEIDDHKRVNDYYQEDVVLKFISSQKVCLFDISNYDYFSGSLKKGSYLLVTFSKRENFSFEAVITFIDNKKCEIECKILENDLHIPFNYDKNKEFKVHVRSKWIGEALKRMADALENLQSHSSEIFAKIEHLFWKQTESSISSNPTDNNSINSLKINISSRLNEHQRNAVVRSLRINDPPITLIQGPPGTGKTTTLYEIVNQINRWNLSTERQNNLRVLFCAPSNIAVDNLAVKLKENNIEFIRVYSRIREENDDIDQKIKQCSLHYLAEEKTGIQYNSLLPLDEKKIYNQAERILLRPVNIICCTCSCAGDKRFLGMNPFDYVIIDEAAQSLEMETLIPLNLCKKKFVLCGDHKQLGPLVFSKLAKSRGLGISMFERLTKENLIQPEFLASQYRMHEKIAAFPSQCFYKGQIKTQVTRTIDTSFPWPKPKIPLMFRDIYGKEEIGPKGISYLNRAEAEFVKKMIDKLLKINKKPQDIGVITPYLAQKHFLLNEMHINERVAVNSIDGFQGKEKDYIIISCVRSNDEIGVGFLHELNRVNVALTRAKFGLIICGNVNTLEKNEIWGKIINYYRKKGVLVKEQKKKETKKVKKDNNRKKK